MARDINRIDMFCKRLAEAWKKYPDYRFGQMIKNVEETISPHTIFYVEDDEMIEMIEAHMGKIGWSMKKD